MNDEREHIRDRWPSEFSDGARRAYLGDRHYPSGFFSWPPDRRNAWFAGFNVGHCDRARARQEREPAHG